VYRGHFQAPHLLQVCILQFAKLQRVGAVGITQIGVKYSRRNDRGETIPGVVARQDVEALRMQDAQAVSTIRERRLSTCARMKERFAENWVKSQDTGK
jgi:hypothetical protein